MAFTPRKKAGTRPAKAFKSPQASLDSLAFKNPERAPRQGSRRPALPPFDERGSIRRCPRCFLGHGVLLGKAQGSGHAAEIHEKIECPGQDQSMMRRACI